MLVFCNFKKYFDRIRAQKNTIVIKATTEPSKRFFTSDESILLKEIVGNAINSILSK